MLKLCWLSLLMIWRQTRASELFLSTGVEDSDGGSRLGIGLIHDRPDRVEIARPTKQCEVTITKTRCSRESRLAIEVAP